MNRNHRIFVESYLRRKKRKKEKENKEMCEVFQIWIRTMYVTVQKNLKVKRESKKEKEFEHKIEEENKTEKHCTYFDLPTIIFA